MGNIANGGRKQNNGNTAFSQKAPFPWISLLLAAPGGYKRLCIHAIRFSGQYREKNNPWFISRFSQSA